MARLNRLLLTGAAGGLGRVLRSGAAEHADVMRLNDREDLGAAGKGEEVIQGDMADADFMLELTRDVDMVVHMGGQSTEGTWESVLNSNIIGLYNLFEGARKNGVKRVIWASSVHAVGYHPTTTTLDTNVPTRPDTNYGVSKAFGENLAQYYWDKYGLESVSIRIYSCFPEPLNYRMLSTWMSYPDFTHLIERCILTAHVGHTIIYGISNNSTAFVSNAAVGHMGYQPKDNGEDFRAMIEARDGVPGPQENMVTVHGGQFADFPHFDD